MREEKNKQKKIDKMKNNLKKLGLCILVLIVCTIIYAHYIETKKLNVKEYKIINENFTEKKHGYKIAHISDIHYGSTTDKKTLESIVEKINLINPDILFFTGDLIDKDTNVTEEIVEELEEVLSKINKDILLYQIKGEDDTVFDKYDLVMENVGFTSLNNKYQTLYLNQTDYILLAGIETIKSKKDYDSMLTEVNEYINTEETKPIYTILLMHEPDTIDSIDIKDYNMILAGHTHAGQVRLPLIGAIKYPKYASKYHKDYEKKENTDIFISSGIGTTAYPFRLLNAPSINVYRLLSY
jgi:hypothetical protein